MDLPFYLLPDIQLEEIGNAVGQTSNHFAQINDLDIRTANNPQQTVQSLGDAAKGNADQITIQMAPWISYLAYQKGDVSRNISQIESAVSEAQDMVSAAKTRVEAEERKIQEITQRAQDFSGDKGVSIFTEQFDKNAIQNSKESNKWLRYTIVIFGITIGIIVFFMFGIWNITQWYEWILRAALIGVFVTAGLWCGKTYRILRHQQAVNQYKANGLKSFLLFRDAAGDDEATRNAVLMETTKSIFSSVPTGFIRESGNQKESEIRLIETPRVVSAAAQAEKLSRPDGGGA